MYLNPDEYRGRGQCLSMDWREDWRQHHATKCDTTTSASVGAMAQGEGAVPDDRCVGANQGVDEAPRVWEEIRGRRALAARSSRRIDLLIVVSHVGWRR